MAKYEIIGTGPDTLHPIHRQVATAAEALQQQVELRRNCGHFGNVEIFTSDGRLMTPYTIRQAIKDEAPKDGAAPIASTDEDPG